MIRHLKIVMSFGSLYTGIDISLREAGKDPALSSRGGPPLCARLFLLFKETLVFLFQAMKGGKCIVMKQALYRSNKNGLDMDLQRQASTGVAAIDFFKTIVMICISSMPTHPCIEHTQEQGSLFDSIGVSNKMPCLPSVKS